MKDYKELLQDERWLTKRDSILKRDKDSCQFCMTTSHLNVHHKAYIYGKDPWDYPDYYLITICNSCHSKLHSLPVKELKEETVIEDAFDRIQKSLIALNHFPRG